YGVCGRIRTQMANRLVGSLHCRFRPALRATEGRGGSDVLWSAYHFGEQLDVVLLSHVPIRALPHSNTCPGRGIRLFLEPPQHGFQQLSDCPFPAQLRHDWRVYIYCLQHADGVCADRRLRAKDDKATAGGDRALALAAEVDG